MIKIYLTQDRRVVIWSKDSEASTQWIQKELHSFEDVVWHVSWSVSGNMLAVSGGDNKGTSATYVFTLSGSIVQTLPSLLRCIPTDTVQNIMVES